jgi:hypothetical protein
MSNLVRGSVGQIAQERNIPLSEALMDVEELFLIDTSGSMRMKDAGSDMQRRYDKACAELAALQEQHSGRCLIYSCSDETHMELGGTPRFQMGGTPIHEWLEEIKQFDGMGIRIHVISDGTPDNADAALAIARRMHSVINTIYIGPLKSEHADPTLRTFENNQIKAAREFMIELAKCGRGQHVTTSAKLLRESVNILLLPAGR